MLQATRDLVGRLQDERERSRRGGLEQPVPAVIDLGVGGDFRKIAADQSEVVLAVGLADMADAFRRRLVAEPAAALDLILPSDLELKEP